MKNFFKTILLFFCLLIFTTNVSAEDNGLGCGMVEEGGHVIVEKESFEICENDISMNVLYILFTEIFDQDEVAEILDGVITISPETQAFAYSTGIGDSIMAIFNSLTNIVISIATLLISISLIKVVYKTQTSGEFMGNKQSKVFPVIFNNMFIIFLITPIGSVLVIQVIIVLIAVLAIMLGNYFWSTFLHSTQVKSSEAVLNEEMTIRQAEGITAEFVMTAACMERTNQNILNKKYRGMSAYDSGHDNNQWLTLDDEDSVKESLLRVHKCLQYYVSPNTDEFNIVSSYSFKRPDISNCAGVVYADGVANVAKAWSAEDYIADAYGSEHLCGSMYYANVDLKNMFPATTTGGVTSAGKERELINSLKDKISTAAEFRNFEQTHRSAINGFVTAGTSAINKASLYKKYETTLQDLEKKISEMITIPEIYKGKPKLAGKAIYLQSSVLLNQLLGSKYVEYKGGFEDLVDGYKEYHPMLTANQDFKFKQMDTEIKSGKVKVIEQEKFGIETLMNQAKLSFDYFEQAHCAKNWDKLLQSRKTAFYLNFASFADVPVVKAVPALGVVNFECVKLTNKEGEYGITYNVEDVSDADKYTGLTSTMYSVSNKEDAEKINTIKNKMNNDIYTKKIHSALVEKYILEGYIYYVKMAVSRALTEKLKDLQDENMMKEIREQGWSSGGSMMLKITMEQGNASVFKNGLFKTGIAGSNLLITENENTFINEESLSDNLKNNEDENKKDDEEENNLIKMSFYSYLLGEGKTIKTNDRISLEQSKQSQEESAMASFMGYFENLLFSPIIYIKQASGLNKDSSLTDGLKKCREKNEICVSKDTHPLNALMMFGQELLSNAILLLIVDVVVQALVAILDSLMGDNDPVAGVKKDKSKSLMKKAVKMMKVFVSGPINIFIYALKGIAVFFDIIRSVLYLFVMAGIFLGFILPTIPYISFAIVFLGWIISIFQMMIVAPIYILLAAIDGNERGQLSFMKFWELTGGILLKPALLTIAIIFGWTLSSISLFYINATVYSLFSATSPDTFLLNIIFKAMTYVVYITLVYITIYHSFKVINKMPDEILSLVNVRGSGDSQFIESLGAEKLIQAKMASDLIQKASENSVKPSKEKLGTNQQKRKIADQVAEDRAAQAAQAAAEEAAKK